MPTYQGMTQFAHERGGKTVVLLLNLGTPDAPDTPSVRRYLAEFLSDPRIVEMPRWLWKIILHGVILRIRPSRSAHAYQQVWTEQGSPLLTISRQQQQALQARLGEGVQVELAMRYGQPSMQGVMDKLVQQGVERLLVLPLYPQYSGTTTGSTFDRLGQLLQRWRWVPQLHFINSYHDHPLYIEALAGSVEAHEQAEGKPDKWLLSFHGTPKRYHRQGDPYYCFCHVTAKALAARMGWQEHQYQLCFQSRFGREEWLKPYTDETLKTLPGQGVKRVATLSPGFSADCLETLEEMAVENREVFLQAGGEEYHYVPALNDSAAHIDLMEALLQPYLPS